MTDTQTPKLDYANPALRREIGLFGAVMLGLGSILGTGVFVSLAHATELAGPWVLLAIVLAGLLAYCNAMSSAQLAAAYPVSGGTYEYGYRVLNPMLGFTAGWMFLLAKSASAATAALALGHIFFRYLEVAVGRELLIGIFDVQAQTRYGTLELHATHGAVMLGLATIVSLIAATLGGLRRSSILNAIVVTITLAGLLWFVVMLFPGVWPFWRDDPANLYPIYRSVIATSRGLVDLLGATALSFVAFTGYGRLATLGEEVRHPTRTIPVAIAITLFISVLLYLAVGFVIAGRYLFPVDLFGTQTLASIASAFRQSSVVAPVVSLSAVTAMLGVLLNLILGLSRVWLAMGRRGDMPHILARVNEKTSTPVPATILSGLVIALLVLVGDVRTTWSFSAFTVLIYYAITNLACLRLAPEHRRYPRALAWIGLFACLSLAWFVEMKVWIAGSVLIVVGWIWFGIRRRWRVNFA